MCFVTTKTARFKTAKQDLTVYKVVKTNQESPEECVSLYINFIYEKGREYSEKPSSYEEEISVYSAKRNGARVKGVSNPFGTLVTVKSYTTGFHSYLGYVAKEKYFLSEKLSTKTKLAEFVIPKGSKYMVNENGEVFSDKIVFKDFIPCKDVDENQKTL